MSPSPYGRESIRRGIGHYVTGRAFAALASLMVILLLVRVMSVADYGIFVTATSTTTVLAMLSACGLDRVVLKFMPEGRLKASPADLAAFVTRVIGFRMAAIIMLLLPVLLLQDLLFDLLNIPAAPGIVAAMVAYAVLFSFTDFSVYCLQALMLQKQLRLGVSVSWFVRLLAVGFTLAVDRALDVGVVLWIWAGAELVSAAIMAAPLLTVMRSGRDEASIGAQRWPAGNAGVWKLATSNFVSTLVGMPWQPYALRTLAATLLPSQHVAAYGFYQVLVERTRAYLPVYFFASLTEPLMSAHLANGEDKQRVLDNMAIVVQSSIWLLAPIIAVFAIVGGPAIEILTGGKYGDHALVLVVLLCQILLGVHVAMLWSFFSVLGESGVIWRAVALPTIAVFPLLILAGMNYGIIGMALAAPVNTACLLILLAGRLRRLGCRYPFYWAPILRILALAPLAPLPAWLLTQMEDSGNPQRLLMLAMLLLGGILYLAASLVFRPFNRDQTELILHMAPGLERFIGNGRPS